MVRNLYQYFPPTTGIYSKPTFQLISYAQLHWTHTKKVETVIEKTARREVTTVQLLKTKSLPEYKKITH